MILQGVPRYGGKDRFINEIQFSKSVMYYVRPQILVPRHCHRQPSDSSGPEMHLEKKGESTLDRLVNSLGQYNLTGLCERKCHQFHCFFYFALNNCLCDKIIPFSFWANVQGMFTDTFRLMMKCDQMWWTAISLQDLWCAFAGSKHIGDWFATALLQSDSILHRQGLASKLCLTPFLLIFFSRMT